MSIFVQQWDHHLVLLTKLEVHQCEIAMVVYQMLSGTQVLVAMHPPHMVVYWFFFDFGIYGYMFVYVVVQTFNITSTDN